VVTLCALSGFIIGLRSETHKIKLDHSEIIINSIFVGRIMKSKKDIHLGARDDYTFGYQRSVLDYLTYRAKKSLDIVLPHLKPEMEVLECGCGPGIVTFEIAKKVVNGSVIGIDIDKGLIDSNNKKVNETNVKNLKFEVADIHELPYADNSFDVVYMQALIVHIRNPIGAITEVHRVLKDNGLILLKEPVMDRAIISPEDPLLQEANELIRRAISSYGGDPSIGRKLWPLLNGAGFRDIQMFSRWEQPDSLDEWPDFYEGWANVYRGRMGDVILEKGWADQKRLTDIINAFMNLGKSRTGYAGSPWGEGIGRK
jgi:ubiquinone/menaquinone biosynthesis C-methylase UbiE